MKMYSGSASILDGQPASFPSRQRPKVPKETYVENILEKKISRIDLMLK
jgi:hypothetical protein